jgi:23S rRNA (uracil1939-C5)-methyltransferase
MKDTDVVILDPPRVGASEQCEKLKESKVKTIMYVSCNPASFARDANILINGGYRFTDLHIVDQFIWSSHAEVVGVFTRNEKR